MPATQNGRSLVLRWMLPSSVSSGSHTCDAITCAINQFCIARCAAMRNAVAKASTAGIGCHGTVIQRDGSNKSRDTDLA